MNIAYIDYSIKTKSLDIFISGCNPPYCKNCCNPELHDFTVGEKYTQEYLDMKILPYISDFYLLIDKVFIVGGEPTHQPVDEIRHLLRGIKNHKEIDVYLFTRHDLKDVPSDILHYCDYVKCGSYMQELACKDNIQMGIKLASSNQKIFSKGIDF